MSLPRRRTKKLEDKCLVCLLQGELCHSGTHKTGSCVRCGKLKPIDSPPFFWFFNEALGTHMLDMMRTPYGRLILDDSEVEITVRTSNSSSDLKICLMENKFLHRNKDCLKNDFDQKVWHSCILNIGCKMATTSLIKSALYARVYLMFLSPCHVMKGEGSFSNGIQLINFVLTRVSESISEVVNVFNKEHVHDDQRNCSEAAIALAILYYGLHHAQEFLEDPTTQPICNDPQLVCLLVERIKSAMAHLMNLLHPRNLSCDRGWASTLEGSLEEVQSNVKISFLSIKTTKRVVPMNTRSLSSSSCGSASMINTQTPPFSLAATPPGDLDTFNFDSSIGYRWYDTSHGPLLEPAQEMPTPPFYQSQGIDILNHTLPPSDITWGQNMYSSFPIYSYGNEIHKSDFSTSLTSDTLYGNRHGSFTLPQSIPSWQVLGMSSDVRSEKGDKHYPHVSSARSFAYANDLAEETSDVYFYPSFLDLQHPVTFQQMPPQVSLLQGERKFCVGFWQ